MRARIDCVIFDFGGVLSLPRDETRVASMAALCGMDRTRFLSLYSAERAFLDQGRIDRDRYWSRILAGGAVSPSPEILERLGREDCDAWTRLNAPVHAWAAWLRSSGIITAILSNMPRYILDIMTSDSRFSWLASFSPAVFSCEVDLIKPDPRIYALCQDRVGIPAGRCLFLDDHQENVDAAGKAGMHALLFRSASEAARPISRATRLPTKFLT